MACSTAVRLLAASLLAVLACGDDDDGGGGSSLPHGEWTFLAVEGATCADGTPTGVAVNPGPRDDVLVFLDGGGACLDYLTCFELQTASNGPFGEPEFRSDVVPMLAGSAMDRSLPSNPFREWTYVFVPYCTGDVHVGDFVATYFDLQLEGHSYRHVGRRNLALALPRLAEILVPPEKLVVSGASAGGFGATLNYDQIRGTWPPAKGYLVDDSGPLLVGDDVDPMIRTAWALAWDADELLESGCSGCVDDWSAFYGALRERWPGDRFALLSTRRAAVIRSYPHLAPAEFGGAIRRLDSEVFQSLEDAETFLVPGDGHTFLGDPPAASAGGVALEEWLRQMVEDDPAWTSVGP